MESFPNLWGAFCDYTNMRYKYIGSIPNIAIKVFILKEYFQYLQTI
ncbi:hypothetical protein MNBD_BACTEROID06-1547 [hydrothermal vent metagenome]|uniref:Uncharacterized protein n=1 Tax=hydrothermal vent metagenome TaxID=652676 RepID=A0A3B0UGW8_9ZZZZ